MYYNLQVFYGIFILNLFRKTILIDFTKNLAI
jgi:hypothetical protein